MFPGPRGRHLERQVLRRQSAQALPGLGQGTAVRSWRPGPRWLPEWPPRTALGWWHWAPLYQGCWPQAGRERAPSSQSQTFEKEPGEAGRMAAALGGRLLTPRPHYHLASQAEPMTWLLPCFYRRTWARWEQMLNSGGCQTTRRGGM